MSNANTDDQMVVLASSLLSPNTEKAVNDLIKSAPSEIATQPAQTVANAKSEDNFDNLQKAVQILARAKQFDEVKRYDEALGLYRQGVDMLLEELIVRQGTEQSRSYLRDKCNDFMNRIDQLKVMIQIEKTTAEAKEKESQLKA